MRRKWIIKLQDRIIQLTGPHSRLLLKLEAMLKEGIPPKELMLALLRGALAIAEAMCREIAVRTEAQPRRADHSVHTKSLRIGCDRAQVR